MRMKVLGSAAGGGFPQWNCYCVNCTGIRSGKIAAIPRMQSSIAIDLENGKWILVNASPDIRQQYASFLTDQGISKTRCNPVAGIILVDSQIDHTAGLL